MFFIVYIVSLSMTMLEPSQTAKSWRYYPAASNTHGYITTRTKFILEYLAGEKWTTNRWFSEEHCNVENEASPKAVAMCSTSGYHPFGILDQSMTKQDMENILVIKTPYCYEWNMALISLSDNISLSAFDLKFHLWIRKVSELEENNTNPRPSEISKHITKLFYKLGQRPSVFAFVSHSNDAIDITYQEILFSANQSIWEVTIVLTKQELLQIKIDESSVAFLDCFVQTSVFEIHDSKFIASSVLNTTQFPVMDLNIGLKIIQNDCSPNVLSGLLDGKNYLLMTEDYFDTVLATVIPHNLLTKSPIGYKAVFTRHGNLVINTGHETFIIDKNSSQILSAKGLPMSELHFSSYSWCHQDNLPHQVIADTVVAWINETSVYITLNSTSEFISLNVPSYFQNEGFRLLDVKVNGIGHCVFFLFESSTCAECNGSKIVGYTTLNYKTHIWGGYVTKLLDGEDEQFINGSDWSFEFLPPNSFSMLIWNSKDIFYKSNIEDQTIAITRKENSSNPGAERIAQVVTSNNGEYLVLYQDKSLYYGRIGVNYVIPLNSSFPKDVYNRFVFDLKGNAYVVTLNTSLPTVTRKNFALDNEIFNSLYPDVYCPFIQFSFGHHSSSNVLDRWEQFEIWSYLVYKRNDFNDIQLIWNPTKDLLLTVSERKEYYQDVTIVSKTFTFKEMKDENSTFTSSASFSVTLLPKFMSMTCKRPFHKVFHFHTGCPPTRRVFIRDARSAEKPFSEEKENFSLKLSGNTFYPALFMYDGNVLIRRVYSFFNIVELNARTDFAVRVQQDDLAMTIMSFVGSGSYKFSLRFEDKNVSFCKTTLDFDIYVKDESVTNYSYLEFACVTFLSILLLVFLVFNYLMYRKQFLQCHEEDDEAKDRLQELQYLAQLQYYRGASTSTQQSESIEPAGSAPCEEMRRRTALVTGKSERRGHRRSSVFERVSRGVFEDMKVQNRTQSLQEPPRKLEGFSDPSSRRNTLAM